MRVVEEINYPNFKLSIFYMNGKYILKFERGNLEQSYKISELDYIIKDVEDVKRMVNDEFISNVSKNFASMQADLEEALKDF